MIRTDAQLSVSRYAELIGLSRQGFYALRSRHLAGESAKGPWPTPALDAIDADVVMIARARPGWGYRKVWAQLGERGHDDVSLSTVRRAMARRGLLRRDVMPAAQEIAP